MKQKNLWLLAGCPGSGKSYWVAQQSGTVISRDQIRFSLLKEGDEYFSKEQEVKRQFLKAINEAMARGDENVYVDATHLNRFSRDWVRDRIVINSEYNINCIAFDVPLFTCLTQNAQRTGRANVPDTAIKDMYNRFVIPTKEEHFDRVYIYKEGELKEVIYE